MSEIRIHVHEMDCAEEAALVRRALAPVAAVRSIEFDLIHGFVDIRFDPAAASEAVLVRAIESTGLAAHAVHGDEGHAEVAREHAAHDHRHGSSAWIAVSGALFVAGGIVEGLHADHWTEIFVHGEHGGHEPRAIALYAASALVGLWPMWPRALAAVRHRRLDMHVLVCLTVIGAAAIGEWSEGAAVAFLFALAHRMEAWSIERARREIAALVGRGPSIVADGLQETAPSERWIERFAAVYTPLVTAAAVVVAIVPPLVLDGAWAVWFYRALVFLVLACPCALVISTPVTMVAALSAAARRGILVKGGAVLERAAAARQPTRQALGEAGITIVGTQVGPARLEAADVVLTATATDDETLARLVTHARRALAVIRQNVAIALLTKAAFLVSALFGAAPLWLAVLADTGATVIVTFNGLRMLRTK